MSFIDVCKNNDHDEATRLYELGNVTLSDLDSALLSSCAGGRFEIAKWLHDLALSARDRQHSLRKLVLTACINSILHSNIVVKNGYVEIAKCIWSRI